MNPGALHGRSGAERAGGKLENASVTGSGTWGLLEARNWVFADEVTQHLFELWTGVAIDSKPRRLLFDVTDHARVAAVCALHHIGNIAEQSTRDAALHCGDSTVLDAQDKQNELLARTPDQKSEATEHCQ